MKTVRFFVVLMVHLFSVFIKNWTSLLPLQPELPVSRSSMAVHDGPSSSCLDSFQNQGEKNNFKQESWWKFHRPIETRPQTCVINKHLSLSFPLCWFKALDLLLRLTGAKAAEADGKRSRRTGRRPQMVLKTPPSCSSQMWGRNVPAEETQRASNWKLCCNCSSAITHII